MKKTISFSKTYDHPASKVWHALTEPKALSEWLMNTDDIEPTVGHSFKFKTTPRGSFDGVIHCQVKEVIPNEKLVYTWKSGKLDTLVTFQLSEHNGKTIMNFEHSGFERLMDRIFIRNILARGWKKKLLTILLPQYLSK